jgi:hypothetical protein
MTVLLLKYLMAQHLVQQLIQYQLATTLLQLQLIERIQQQ